MRQRLGDLVDPATVCRLFEQEHGPLSWHDLNLLASVEDFHQPEPEKEPENNG